MRRFKSRGFEVAGAAETPGGSDHLVDEKKLDGGGGAVLGEEVAAEGLEILPIFRLDDHVARGETVLERVAAGDGSAAGGAGSSGAPGVAAVGRDLSFGRYGGYLVRSGAGYLYGRARWSC